MPRRHTATRQTHSSEPSGSRHDDGAQGRSYDREQSRSQEHTAVPPRGDRTRGPGGGTTGCTAATTVSRSRSRMRRDSPTAERSGILGTPGRRRSGSPALPPKEMQPGRPMISVGTRSHRRADTPKERPAGGMRVGTTPTDWNGREKLIETAWDPQTPAGRPACMRPTPARPLHQVAEDEVTFRTPGVPLEPRGTERLPTTEPMDRYVRITREGDGSYPAGTTPRLRFNRAFGGTDQHEHPQGRGRLPASQASSSRTTEDHLESLYLHQARLMGVLQAPKVSMPKFEGDLMGYFPFIRAFEENVEKLLDNDGSKLARLTQLCTGKAARAIQCCSMLPPAQGYKKARQLLKTRFGDPFTITEFWVERLTEGPPRANLQEYADDLQNCLECLNALGATGELQSQSSLAALVRKLPPHLQNRRRDVAYELREREGKRPALEDTVKFVGRAATVAADPVYGSGGLKPSRTDKHPSRSSYAAYADVDCPVCEEGRHEVPSCPSFLKESPGDRLQGAIRARLCFVCLRTGTSPENVPTKRCVQYEGVSTGMPQRCTKPTGPNSERAADVREQHEGPKSPRSPLRPLATRQCLRSITA